MTALLPLQTTLTYLRFTSVIMDMSNIVYVVLIDHMDEYGRRVKGVYGSREKAEKSVDEKDPFQSFSIEERKVR